MNEVWISGQQALNHRLREGNIIMRTRMQAVDAVKQKTNNMEGAMLLPDKMKRR